MNKIKLVSAEWLRQIPAKYNLRIIDPDGWDRENFQYSFNEERITFDTFMDRVSISTIIVNHEFFTDITKNGNIIEI
jgi:hypothetical protein